jgi:pentatricopeptide repeat protein
MVSMELNPVSSTPVSFSAASFVWETVGSEAMLLFFFCLGFLVFNSTAMQGLLQYTRKSKLLHKQLEADFASGNYEVLLESAMSATSYDLVALRFAVQVLVALHRFDEVMPLLRSSRVARSLEGLSALVPALSSAPSSLVKDVRDWFASHGVRETAKTNELLINSYTAEDDFDSLSNMKKEGVPLPARSYVKWAKDALKRSNLFESVERMTEMRTAGFFVPAQLVAQLARAGARAGKVTETLSLLRELDLQGETLVAVLEQCQKENQLELLDGVLALARTAEPLDAALPAGALEAAVRAFARRSDPRAFTYWDALMASGHAPSDAFSVQVISLCSEGRNVPLVEHILASSRAAGRSTVAVYSAVMRVYGQARLYHKACDLFPTLVEDGVEPDNVMYGSLIKAAVECGRLDFSRELLRKSGTYDIQNYMSLFRACGRERKVGKALELLQELEQSDVGIDTTAYNCVLDVCVKCGDAGAVRRLFAKMKETGYVDVISFNTLLKDMNAASIQNTDEVLDDMKALGLCPNQITYNSLVNACVSRGDTSLAWKYVSLMKLDGIPLDNFTCSIMMKGLKHSSNRDDVDQTLNLIEHSAVVPDEVLVNTLLEACIRLKDVGRLTSALQAFRSQGTVPSEHAYATVLKAYGHARALPDVWATWNDMLDRKVRPTEATFAAMVEACVANGAVEDAQRVFAEMKEKIPDFATPASTYQTLIRVLVQRKQQDKALEIYEDMRESKVQPNLATFNALIDVCARNGAVEKSGQLFRDMCMLGVTPDLITYSTVIKGYCVQGDLEQAIQLFTLMRKRGVMPDAVLFNSILDGAARKQMTSLVEQVFTDMESSGVSPGNFTLSILVKMYGRNHDIETAFSYFETLPLRYGFEPNAQVYTALMAACASCGRVAQALELFEKVQNPDGKAYSTIITGSLKHGDVAGAVRLLGPLAAGVQLSEELVDNVCFMARRRNMGSLLDPLGPRLAAGGYAAGSGARDGSPGAGAVTPSESTGSRFHARRKQSQSWRDVVVQG